MKTNFKKIAVILGLVVVMVAAFALVASAEKADFTPPADFTDITPANGWVQIASKSAPVDEDGADVELYQLSGGDGYLNKETKTLVILGKTSLTAGYGDWLVKEGSLNVPGKKFTLAYWSVSNSQLVEHIEFRDCNMFNNGGYFLQNFKHVKTVKLAPSANGSNGTKDDTGLFRGMSSLTTVGHGTFEKDGKFTATSYKEGVVDMTGFTVLRPMAGTYAGKAVMYLGSMFTDAASITEVIMPKELLWTGSYTPAVNEGGKWVAGPAPIEAKDDDFGGNYAGVIANAMFKNAELLNKVTIPEGVTLKLIEKNAFSGCASLRCITLKGKVDPGLVIETNAFYGVASGCIIQCSSAEDIETLNAILAENKITNVKAVDMSVEPSPAPKITKLPAAPAWKEIDPASLGATAYGSMKSTYTDNWWVYFQDTKTLYFYAKAAKGYNEVGSIAGAEDGAGWTAYKEEIEHVVIGPKIHKLTAAFAAGMTNLKDIEMTIDITQGSGSFSDNANLTTIFITGMEKVEGQAMLAGAKSNFKLSFAGSAVQSIHMGSSALPFIGNITPGAKTSTLYFDAPSDEMIAYCQENYLNLSDTNGKVYGEWYVEVPEGMPSCGATAVFDFNAETGTLYILGKGAVSDVANYWGGGSKNQHWFDIKKQIKHVVVGDHITAIGKYSFTECENLETVELPAKDGFVILNAAFEDCYNLKSVYIRGNQPIEGTADVSILHEFESYMFADCYLIANAVINENVKKIGSSVFDNCINLQNIYGVPGSFAEEYATKNEFTFFDKAANTPQPIKCEPPAETTEPTETTEPIAPETDPVTEPTETTEPVAPETNPDNTPDTKPVGGNAGTDNGDENTTEGGANILPIIIVVAAVVVVAIVVVVVIIVKKKAPKKD